MFGAVASATPPGVMALEADPCAGVLDVVIVDVAIGATAKPWVGGQALIAYDTTHLFFVGPMSGDPIFDLPIYFASNPVLGHIDLANGIAPGGGDTNGDVVLSRLVFLTLATPSPCPVADLVWFRSDPVFETRLSMEDGTPINPTLQSLNPLSITDGPTITPPADQSWALPLLAGCVIGGNPGFATATSPCGGAPVITWQRSDGELTLTAPYRYLDSPIIIEWTATDDCGNSASADQVIAVTGCLGDLNGDSVVNGADIAIILGFWGVTPLYLGDLNCDGLADGVDIALLLGNWGPC
ncbi:MAG: hypothetical protein KF724_08505 [Phycisphaeraceae bacterium]|nr:hypothetical protein [Phycisphaeraceae bacterium]